MPRQLMLSRQQILLHLLNLRQYKYVSYFGIVGSGKHRCTLIVDEFRKNGLSPSTYIVEFFVQEHPQYLSAVSVDGRIKVERLT